jgi:hypothetical protein
MAFSATSRVMSTVGDVGAAVGVGWHTDEKEETEVVEEDLDEAVRGSVGDLVV